MSDTPAEIAVQIIAGSKTCLECGHTRHDLQALCVVVVDKGAGPQYCSCKSEESRDQYFTREIAAELERKDERIRELVQAARQDAERLDWLSESGVGGRFPGRDFSGGTTIRDAYGYLLGEGKTLREAIDAARAALSKHGGTK